MYLHVSHIKITKYSHEVTAVVLYSLLKNAFELSDDYTDLEEYISAMASKHPQFKFWYTTLEMELTVLSFVRSQRQGDFELYISSL